MDISEIIRVKTPIDSPRLRLALLFALLLPKTISYAKNTQLDHIISNRPNKSERLSRYTILAHGGPLWFYLLVV